LIEPGRQVPSCRNRIKSQPGCTDLVIARARGGKHVPPHLACANVISCNLKKHRIDDHCVDERFRTGIGNTPKVAAAHYLQVAEADFRAACANQRAIASGKNPNQEGATGKSETADPPPSPIFPDVPTSSSIYTSSPGIEPGPRPSQSRMQDPPHPEDRKRQQASGNRQK